MTPRRTPRRRLVAVAALSVAAATLPASPAAVVAIPTASAAPIRTEGLPFGFSDVAVASLASPVAVRAMPDGSVLVLTKPGGVHVVRNGVLVATPALQLAGVCTQSERGLLGVAADADHLTNGFVYLYYTHVDPGAPGGCTNRVSRFTMSADLIDPASEVVLVDGISSNNGNHNGGDLEIGRDGFLYVAVGDAGRDPRGDSGSGGSNDAARDLSLLNGKILRVDPGTGGPAPGNPYSGPGTDTCRVRGNTASTPTTTCQEIFASGLRNPWRFAFDPNAAGVRFFVNDVGQSAREEVNEGILGADYGWNVREGQCPRGLQPPCAGPPAGLTDPITDYGRSVGTFVTGGAFIPNGIWPSQFDGAYFFGDGGSGGIWVRTADGMVDYDRPFHTAPGMVDLEFVHEPGGLALYYVRSGSTADSVRKITFPTQPLPVPSDPLRFVPLAAADRVFDSRRPGHGGAPLTGNAVRTVPLGVDGAVTRAVLVNITYVAPAVPGFLTAWQAGAPRPATSNINALAGEIVANAAVVPVDGAGRIDVLTNASADVVIDVLGRFELAGGPVSAGRFSPLEPARVIDTREPEGDGNRFTTDEGDPIDVVHVPIAGSDGVPVTGASAVVLTVTALAGSTPGGWVTVAPGGSPRPPTSNVNTNAAGDIRPNLVVVPLGADGSVDLHLFRTDDVVVDVTGWFTDASAPAATTGRFRSLTPYREVDTRTPFGFPSFPAPATRVLDPRSVPAGAIGLAHNVTVVGNAGAGFVTAYPDEPRPFASTANASAPDQLRAASAFTRLAAGGSLHYYSMVTTDLVVDVTGFFES